MAFWGERLEHNMPENPGRAYFSGQIRLFQDEFHALVLPLVHNSSQNPIAVLEVARGAADGEFTETEADAARNCVHWGEAVIAFLEVRQRVDRQTKLSHFLINVVK